MSGAINDGGPAFPVDFDHHTFQPKTVAEARHLMSGMSLRDYFAGQALIGWWQVEGTTFDTDAKSAYAMADAMLRARAQAQRSGQ